MKPKPAHRRDENEDAAEVVRQSTERADELPADVEAAWRDWSRRIQGLDDRMRTLLRAAFEAGASAAQASPATHATQLGRLGASKGGTARAARLSKKRKLEIARKAARTRWSTAKR